MRLEIHICLLSFNLILICYAYPDELFIPDTSPEIYPYTVLIKGTSLNDDLCSGILIKTDFVIVPASCVCKLHKVVVYLGFSSFPTFKDNLDDSNGKQQQFISSNIVVHEDFAEINKHRYLNNIALVQLPHPVEITKTVHPGKLITRAESLLLDGKIVHVNGWSSGFNTKMKEAHVRLRTRDTCRYLFGDSFFANQESCVNWLDKDHLDLQGNIVSIDGKIIGFQTVTPKCLSRNIDCTQNDMILNIVPYIDWVAFKTHSTITDLTGEPNYDQEIEMLHNEIESWKKILEESDTLLSGVINDIINKFAWQENKEKEYKTKLEEELNTIRTQIHGGETSHNSSILKLQEEIGDARNEFTSGLSAEKTNQDSLEKRINLLESQTSNQQDILESLGENIKKMQPQLETVRLDLNEITADLQQQVYKLINKIELVENQDKCPSCVEALKNNVSKEFDNVTNIINEHHNVLKHEIDQIIEKLNGAIRTERENFDGLSTHFQNGEEKLKLASERLDVMEHVINEQRIRFDKQVIKEIEHFQLNKREKELLANKINSCCASGFFNHHYMSPSAY